VPRLTSILLVLSLAGYGQTARGAASSAPAQQLRYFLGDWQSTAIYKSSILGPAGTYRSNEHSEMLGDLILVTRAQGSWISGGPPSAPHKVQELTITRYDAAKKLFIFDGFNNSGEHTTAKQTCVDNSCVATGSFELDHSTIKTRFTLREVSSGRYTYAYDVSQDGGRTWTRVMDGNARKTK
jgi:hypothetical protein